MSARAEFGNLTGIGLMPILLLVVETRPNNRRPYERYCAQQAAKLDAVGVVGSCSFWRCWWMHVEWFETNMSASL